MIAPSRSADGTYASPYIATPSWSPSNATSSAVMPRGGRPVTHIQTPVIQLPRKLPFLGSGSQRTVVDVNGNVER